MPQTLSKGWSRWLASRAQRKSRDVEGGRCREGEELPEPDGESTCLGAPAALAARKSKLLFSHAAMACKSRPSPEGAVMPTSSQLCQQQLSPLQSPTKGDPPCDASRAGGPAAAWGKVGVQRHREGLLLEGS